MNGVPVRMVLVLSAISLCWTAAEGQEASRVKTLLHSGGPIHDFKGVGDAVERALAAYDRFDVTRVDNQLDVFLPESINQYDLVVFYYTLGELTDAQRSGLLEYVRNGGGYITFHSGADSFRGDKEYAALVGGHFVGHPHYRPFQVSCSPDHPITQGILEFFTTDEQYFLQMDSEVNSIGISMFDGKPVPTVWTREEGEGRVVYLSLGHDAPAAENDGFQRILLRGALWAAGEENLEAGPEANLESIFDPGYVEGRLDGVRGR